MARKLTKDDIVQYSFRLNLNIDAHLKIHQMLQNLSDNSKGAKSRFVIDALTKALGGNANADASDPDLKFVTRGEMKKNNDKLIQEFSADIMARIIAQTALLAKSEKTAETRKSEDASQGIEINNDMMDMINHYSQM